MAVGGHASGLSRESIDQLAFKPIQVDIFKKLTLRFGVDDHGARSSVYFRALPRARATGYFCSLAASLSAIACPTSILSRSVSRRTKSKTSATSSTTA